MQDIGTVAVNPGESINISSAVLVEEDTLFGSKATLKFTVLVQYSGVQWYGTAEVDDREDTTDYFVIGNKEKGIEKVHSF